ncbi:MAG: DUF3237 domain-containing protein [Gammaproteobacteria bacterium]|nr:DUF3237 domain-containing protein [Gammaproteobacteria bacterium]
MKLEPLMTYHASLLPAVAVGAGPYGQRAIFEVTSGAFEGPRLRGILRTGGGDWMLIDAQGVGHLDVRATFETHDGALIYVQYFGSVVLTEALTNALQGNGETDYGDTYFFTQPRFETGDARYAWLNQVIAVGQGRVRGGRVEYQVSACVND